MTRQTTRRIGRVVFGAIVLGAIVPAMAVIKVDLPVSRIYEVSKFIIVGEVTAVHPETHSLEAKTTQTVKGDPGPAQFRVQLTEKTEGMIANVHVGDPLIVFASKKPADPTAIHLAGTWFLAKAPANAQTPLWRIVQTQDVDQKAFPGRTAALVHAVEEMKTGKSTLLDAADDRPFRSGAKELAKLPVNKPTFLLAADVNGDKKPDLIVGTAEGAKLFLATGNGYADATAKMGLTGATGTAAAAGDANGDGKVDLLIGKTLFINDGQKFTPSKSTLALPDASKVLAAALADVNGDKKTDAAVLLADGTVLTFANPGAPDAPWAQASTQKLPGAAPITGAFGDFGDDGRLYLMSANDTGITRHPVGAAPEKNAAVPADYTRLTGYKLTEIKDFANGLKNPACIAIDTNGDGRADFLLASDTGSLLLVNRGFGGYLPNPDAGAELAGAGDKPLPTKVTPATAWTAADLRGDGHQSVLVLLEDGRLLALENAGPQKKP